MAEFVNKVKKNDVEYEIHDARIDVVPESIPVVNVASIYETLSQEQIDTLATSDFAVIKTGDSNVYELYEKVNSYPEYMGNTMAFSQTKDSGATTLSINKTTGEISSDSRNLVPSTSGLDGNKTYTLKNASGGRGITWIEDTSSGGMKLYRHDISVIDSESPSAPPKTFAFITSVATQCELSNIYGTYGIRAANYPFIIDCEISNDSSNPRFVTKMSGASTTIDLVEFVINNSNIRLQKVFTFNEHSVLTDTVTEL